MTETRCVIAGCGPAGAVLGLLLARADVPVVVLEKHADFLRDFRGDTIHPATLEILDQIGLADGFLRLPHAKVRAATFRAGDDELRISLERLPSKFPYIAFVPQWDFLDFVTDEAARYPTFTLVREAEVTGLVEDDGIVRGVRYRKNNQDHELRALLTVGADGRGSVTREAAGLPLVETSPPMDVLWFRLSARPDETAEVGGRLGRGRMAVALNRREYWQIAYVIPKGGDAPTRAAGLDAFRAAVAELLPEFADRVGEIESWDQVKLLSVRSDRLERWFRPGYLAIGDAAHAMSPIAGVGINLAIQDAVVAANVLWEPLRQNKISTADLAKVQREREFPTKAVQAVQGFMQSRFIAPALRGHGDVHAPAVAKLLLRTPFLRDLPGRWVGLGVRRARVTTPALATPRA